MTDVKKTLEKKTSSLKKSNPSAPNSPLQKKETSQLQSAQKAANENHNGSTNVFSHGPANRGK